MNPPIGLDRISVWRFLVAALFAILSACTVWDIYPVHHGRNNPDAPQSSVTYSKVRPITLLTAGGDDVVAVIDPTPYFDRDGRLPNTIVWNGRKFERGWTNEGNTDADERLWFEVKP